MADREPMELEAILDALRSRSDELKLQGPGRVDVAKIHDIGEVRLLRACREAISPEETIEIRRAVVEMKAHLQGIERVAAPPKDNLVGRLMKALSGGLAVGVTDVAHENTADRSGAPPKSLLDAAEAWAIAQASIGRVEGDRSPLLAPWLNATVTTVD